MKRAALMLVVAAVAVGFAGDTRAADTDQIAVTVSLESILSISITPDTWDIGTLTEFGGQFYEDELILSNDGTENVDVSVHGTDGAGGWTLSETGPDVDKFSVTIQPNIMLPADALSTTPKPWVGELRGGDGVGPNQMTYYAPTGNTRPTGIPQDCTIIFTATVHVP